MVNIGIVGIGNVGSEFVSQLVAYAKRSTTPQIKVVAIANTLKHLLSNSQYDPLDLSSWQQNLKTKGVTSNLEAFIDYLSKSPESAIVVDNTASQAVANQYPSWLRKGLHIVTPNKKAFSSDLQLYREILTEAEKNKKLVYHESSVGAGLPVINTLNDLVKTGDEIIKIEGIFSGTLSYIFNSFSSLGGATSEGTQKFSDIVKIAKANGFTEPDPRDDLNGLDVARKVVILGRLAGLDLTLETLPVENIVPEKLRSLSTAGEFLEKLSEYDQHFENLNKMARDNNQVLRYVGLVDLKGGKGSVNLASLPATHPFASLKGSDNIISFTTRRFQNSLIIIGAGAGAAVTAFGVFSDVLKVVDKVQPWH